MRSMKNHFKLFFNLIHLDVVKKDNTYLDVLVSNFNAGWLNFYYINDFIFLLISTA
jgi:hypothetical protein